MNADDYQKLKDIFNSALDLSPEDRSAFVAERCNGDDEMLLRVEKLLDSNDNTFLETPAANPFSETPSNNCSRSGQRIGHYEVIRRVGSGGMGDVYLAVDGKLGRQVAIKILPDEFTTDENRLDRFQLEARSASSLSHPNILTIFEVGEWQGTHYIATEYVEGETLRQRLGPKGLSIGESMDLGIQLVSAIAAAHEASICHRDIKPENIMIRRDGLLKVVDFGLAKLVASPFRSSSSPTLNDEPTVKIVNTEPGVIMGTVQYMSPEQTRGLATGERSDIWSLGCVLYEMLTGHAPFKGETSADMVAEIVKTHPELPSRLASEVPERLDEIISKSLEKNPDERYQTAKDLLIDLKRLRRNLELEDVLERSNPSLRNEPVTTVTSTPNIISTKKGPKDLTEVNSAQYLYWGMKAHRWTAIGITLFVLSLLGGTALLVRYFWKAGDPNERRLAYANKIKLAAQALEMSNLSLARTLLDEVVPTNGEPDFRSFEWGYLDRLYSDRSASQPIVLSREKWVSAVAFSPDGKQLATAGADNIVTLWDVPTGRELKTLTGHSKWITSVEFSPDGRRLLTGGFDSTAKVWDVDAGSELLTLTAANNGISKPAFSKNGTLVSAFANDAIRTWDSSTGKELGTLYKPAVGDMAFVFSSDEKLFAIRDVDQNVRVIDASSGATVAKVKGHTGLVTNIKFSPDSRFLLTASFDGTAKLWEIKTGKEVRTFKGHTDTILTAVFSPDGKMVATGSNDDSIKIWNTEDGFLIDTLRGHTGDIGSLAFSRDGRRLASGGTDNRARIWPAPQNPPQGVLRGHSKTINSVAFSKDSKMLASTSEDGTARIWDADTERQRLLLDHDAVNVLSVTFSHDGKILGTGGPKFLKLWSAINGREERTISTEGRINSIDFSSDDRMIATTDRIQIWDRATGQSICSTEHLAWTAEFMAEANRLLTSGGSDAVRTWDLKTCSQVSEFQGETGFDYYAVYSQTGKPWAFQVLNESRSLKLIDTVSGKEIASFSGHEAELWDVDFTPDGKRLATSDISGVIKIWDVPTGHELLTLKANVGEFSSAAFSPDGKTFAAAGHDSIVRLFRSTY